MNQTQETVSSLAKVSQFIRSAWKETIIAIVAAVVGAFATALLEPPVHAWYEKRASVKVRNDLHIDNTNLNIIATEWDATWEYDDGSPPLRDKVTFTEWSKDNFFDGYGIIQYPKRPYKYSIKGEVSQNRVVLLTYKAQDYPTEANIGSACLLLSSDAQDLGGTWTGLQGKKEADGTEILQLRSGKVTMHRVNNLGS
jgi:hypothetical protein